MSTEKTDKTLSGILILLTVGVVLFALNSFDAFPKPNGQPLNEIISNIITHYLDIVIIIYVFTCLQIAGYLELKHRQDFLTVAVVSVLFTPLAVFFIMEKGNDE